jgi:hypothetical protein
MGWIALLTLAKPVAAGTGQNRWQKGQSGNPIGRRAEIERYGTVDIKALARSYGPEAIKTLVHCLRDPRYKLQAAVALLDRGYGKPHIEVHSQSESTVLHLIAAQQVGDALIEAIGDRPMIDGEADERTAALSDAPPLE